MKPYTVDSLYRAAGTNIYVREILKMWEEGCFRTWDECLNHVCVVLANQVEDLQRLLLEQAQKPK